MAQPSFTSIVISGGAMKVISTIGCYMYLEEHNMVGNIRNFVGTSAGSIICFFILLQYRSAEIITFMSENLNDKQINTFDMEKVFNLLSDYGISDGSNIVEFLERMLYKKLKVRDITFLEMTKILGKNFVVCVSNLTKETEEFMSVDTHPNMSVIKAIRASCSIPYLFNPVKFDDQLYIDGALYNNFPVNYFKENRLKDILGINIVQKNYQKTSDIISYSLFLVYSVINKVNKKTYEDNDKNIVTIDIEDTEWFSFQNLQVLVTKEMIENYTKIGYNLMKEKFT